ncbi:fungal-specific transcription factor domain-containing protein [Zalerion maritima]|uniref:Fungal-specific transcription factor domain-containing protein n=1 Tax=Zalerion maritima TaxID=339359 RepID=A0AAD5WRL1_9PEZI|nr:fungal-specific transcription factor domain-containing protein [Zalerion maritima]
MHNHQQDPSSPTATQPPRGPSQQLEWKGRSDKQTQSLPQDIIENPETSSTVVPSPRLQYVPLPSRPTCNQAPSPGSSQKVAETGSMHFAPTGTVYVGGAHWTAILDGIAELRTHFDEQDQSREKETGLPENSRPSSSGGRSSCDSGPDSQGPSLLFGYPKLESEAEILAALPERKVADRLVFQYFHLADIGAQCLHTGQFLRQYEQFWKQPSSAPIIWVGQLFGIMCLGIQFQILLAYSDGPRIPGQNIACDEMDQQAHLYRDKLVQCLLVGKYAKGQPGVMEVLIHYWAIEHLSRPDPEFSMWLLLGVIVRLGFRMGYHRDPSNFPELTPFQGHMRRKVWMVLYSVDVIVSMQMAMPRMIKDSHWDTCMPDILEDEDFKETTKELPKGRPGVSMGSLSYQLVKHKLAMVMGPISDVSTAARQCPYNEVIRLDTKLDEVYDSFPPAFKLQNMTMWLADKPWNLTRRVYTTLVYFKSKLLLHRRYMEHTPGLVDAAGGGGVSEAEAAYSRKTCISSAIKALELQHLIDEEIQPYGRLHSVKWKMSSTVSVNFLAATMVLCAHLYKMTRPGAKTDDLGRILNDKKHSRMVQLDQQPLKYAGCGNADEIRALLKRSQEIWKKTGSRSREGRRAAEALDLLFRKLDDTPAQLPTPGAKKADPTAGSDSAGAPGYEPETPMWLNGQFDDAQMFDLQMADIGPFAGGFDFHGGGQGLHTRNQTKKFMIGIQAVLRTRSIGSHSSIPGVQINCPSLRGKDANSPGFWSVALVPTAAKQPTHARRSNNRVVVTPGLSGRVAKGLSGPRATYPPPFTMSTAELPHHPRVKPDAINTNTTTSSSATSATQNSMHSQLLDTLLSPTATSPQSHSDRARAALERSHPTCPDWQPPRGYARRQSWDAQERRHEEMLRGLGVNEVKEGPGFSEGAGRKGSL